MASDEQNTLISYIESIDEKITSFRKEYQSDRESDRRRIRDLEDQQMGLEYEVGIIKRRHEALDDDNDKEQGDRWYHDKINQRAIVIVSGVVIIFGIIIASLFLFGHELTSAILEEAIK